MLSVFDGRLDNRDELLDALNLHSLPDAPLPDGEIVRAAYERWEEDAVPRLLGDFAWAVWNGRDRRLMLARDHSALRALFFSRGDGFAAFATGYRPLLALPEISRDVDELAVADLLLSSSDDSGRSFYKSISWVGPATRVVVAADGVRQERLWEPALRPTLRLPRDEDYVEAARAVFDEAVACRLRIAGPLVSAVSGGLDCSAVAATAARQRAPDTVHGLCAVPVGGAPLLAGASRYADERPFAMALAACHPNLSVECLASAEPAPFELDPVPVFLNGAVPFSGPTNLGWFMGVYQRAGELGATTLLQGHCGNITLSADGFDRLSVLRRDGAWLMLLREFAALRRTMPEPLWRGLLRYHALKPLPGRLRAGLRWLRHGGMVPSRLPPLIRPDFVRDASLAERFARDSAVFLDTRAANGRLAFLRYLVLRSRPVVEGIGALRIVTGITLSDPFGDRRVIDFCLSLPPEQFQYGGVWRRLARRAFADRLPPEITGNRRRGAQNPDWHLRLTPHREHFAAELERLDGSQLAGRILDLPRMKRILAGWPDDPHAVEGSGVLYHSTLMRALHLGRYLRWVEGGNQ
ncbi:hypothetical protein TSO221_12240 [Azospirillum sp. TSO22-1]|nr:hypothetical protein TSO221_12240 [Azospirillum sp. TSO22-1]